MISPEDEAEIRRLHYAEGWKVGTIANQTGHHHTTVSRVLANSGVDPPKLAERSSMLAPYLPFVLETLEQYPALPASRLFEMVKRRGYPGGQDHFRHLIALHRPRRPAEAYLRVRTLIGEQAQVDWGHFGKIQIGRAERLLMAFVLVLSWSRQIFLRFFPDARMENFLRGHQGAFEAWGGVPRTLLYDNLKSAVLERRGDAIRFHPTLLDFSGHHCYKPKPVAIARGNEKGRVERAIRFVRSSFFAAREWRDLDDLNAQAEQWCHGIAADRPCPEDRSITVREAFAQERSKLLPLPENPYPSEERVQVQVGKTPYVRFDCNDYSVPHTLTRQSLSVVASPEIVRVLSATEEVARHQRTYSKGEQVENPQHIEALTAKKKKARRHRGLDRLHHGVPRCDQLFEAMAQRGINLGSATVALLGLLETYGAKELDQAIAEVLEHGAPGPHAVRLALEQQHARRDAPPPLPITLPDDDRVRGIIVRTHDLATYDTLNEEDHDKNKE